MTDNPLIEDPSANADPEGADPAAERRPDRKLRRLAMIVLGALGVLLLVAFGTVALMYFSATAKVEQYEAVVEIDPAQAEADRLELESQLAALYNDTRSANAWQATLSDAQINGWLATRLKRDFPGFAAAGLSAPRVWIEEDRVTLAVRAKVGRIDGVLSVAARPSVTEAGELMLEILEAKVGRLSIPLQGVIAQARQTPLEQSAPIRWSQSESQVAVVIDLDRVDLPEGQALNLLGVDLRPGELLIRGESTTTEEPTQIPPSP